MKVNRKEKINTVQKAGVGMEIALEGNPL